MIVGGLAERTADPSAAPCIRKPPSGYGLSDPPAAAPAVGPEAIPEEKQSGEGGADDVADSGDSGGEGQPSDIWEAGDLGETGDAQKIEDGARSQKGHDPGMVLAPSP